MNNLPPDAMAFLNKMDKMGGSPKKDHHHGLSGVGQAMGGVEQAFAGQEMADIRNTTKVVSGDSFVKYTMADVFNDIAPANEDLDEAVSGTLIGRLADAMAMNNRTAAILHKMSDDGDVESLQDGLANALEPVIVRHLKSKGVKLGGGLENKSKKALKSLVKDRG
jgi:hypothetical protein